MRDKKYLIGEVSKLTGASPKRIRNWEKYIGKVDRITCGKMSFRYYTEQQVELIKTIKEHVDAGLRLDFAALMALESKGIL